MSEEFEFKAQVSCSFISPKLDNLEIFLIAEYDVTGGGRGDYVDGIQVSPDEYPEVEIITVKPKSEEPTLLEFAVADMLTQLDDFDHLETDILNALSEDVEADRGDYLYQLMKDKKLELAS